MVVRFKNERMHTLASTKTKINVAMVAIAMRKHGIGVKSMDSEARGSDPYLALYG